MKSGPALIVIATIAVIAGVATLMVMRSRQPHPATGVPAGMTGRSAMSSSFVPGVVFVAVSLILTVLLTAAYTTYVVQSSNQKWCDTMTLLTTHPVPKPSNPAQNPSRQQSYVLYQDFVKLKGQLGCG